MCGVGARETETEREIEREREKLNVIVHSLTAKQKMVEVKKVKTTKRNQTYQPSTTIDLHTHM